MSVVVSRNGNVAEVLLNRPEKFNAVDGSIFEGLEATTDALRSDRSVRAVVLHGAGENFCAGIDLEFLQGAMDPVSFRELALELPDGEIANFFQRPTMASQSLPVPVVCALQGVAFGAGCQFALGADIRIAAPDTRMSLMEMKWGLVPDMGMMATLPKLVRYDQACELVMTGRIVEAPEAFDMGLITHISDTPLDAARELAQRLATQSPDAVRAAKHLLTQGWQADAAQALRLEAEMQVSLVGRANQLEAVAANLQRRPPIFKD